MTLAGRNSRVSQWRSAVFVNTTSLILQMSSVIPMGDDGLTSGSSGLSSGETTRLRR